MAAALFTQLVEFLDEQLTENECDHTHRVTEDFLAEAGEVEAEELLTGLIENGSVCDCEVLADLEEEFRR